MEIRKGQNLIEITERFKNQGNLRTLLSGLFLILFCTGHIFASAQEPHQLYVGWSTKSITPDKPVALDGQFETRISTGVMDPVTCTALAIETRDGNKSVETAIMVSCDLVAIEDNLYKEVTGLLKKELPGFDSGKLILNATHTHTGPVQSDGIYEIPKDAIQPAEYVKFAAGQIVSAVVEAWNARKPAGMSWGLGQAVVGYN